jgi:hypothetical protein
MREKVMPIIVNARPTLRSSQFLRCEPEHQYTRSFVGGVDGEVRASGEGEISNVS